MEFLATSDALHDQVQAFARGEAQTSFEALALEIARYQTSYSPGFARLVARSGRGLSQLDDIPAVPVEAFRLSRVATYPRELDVARFQTSGTSGGACGIHALRRLDTYQQVSLLSGCSALLRASQGPMTVVALATPPSHPPNSSLGYMLELFMAEWDGRPLLSPGGGGFTAHAPERWLLREAGVELGLLEQVLETARQRGEPVLLLATAFALVALLDQLNGRRLRGPQDLRVMQTGGFKGRTRELAPDELRRGVAESLQIPESQVVGEYGMTELTSQLYEGVLSGSALNVRTVGLAQHGVYVEPPWLRVIPVDAQDLQPVPAGEVGLARIIDLANVDSALAILTQDQVCRVPGGVKLLGRAPGAPPRGCSLSVEAFLVP